MVNDYLKKFEFNYESSATGSFLVVSTDAGENVLLYQVEMLANNPNRNILPLDIRQKDSKHNFYYNITSKLALSQYLRRNKLKRDDFINIFKDILKTILSSKDYLLSDRSYILNEDYIYIVPNTMEVSLAYLPLNIDINVNDQLKNFTMNFIMFSANIDETNNDNFLQRILNLLKSDTFSILEFSKLLNDLKLETDIPKPEVQKPVIQEHNVPVQPAPAPAAPKASAPRPNIPKAPVSKPDVPKSGIPKPNVPRPAPQGPVSAAPAKPAVNTAEKTVVRIKYKTGVLIAGAILQAVIIIGSIALLASGAMDSLGNEPIVNMLGIGILAGALSYAVWKTVLNEKNKVETVSTVRERPAAKPQINMEKRNFTTVSNNQSIPPINKAPSQPESNFNNAASTPNSLNETTVIFPSPLEETVYLGTSNSYPYLQGTMNGVMEQIIINKPSFVIGRLKSQVDYISQNNAVGKVHAEIISRDGRYFVKDLNSRNGTFVNGIRLAANTEHEIKNNDKITFANSEYTFIIP
ncbi:DUF6382 domain-containing protein [Acetivibrio straminisolvens]|uniref:Membrane protein n=1 Tax=Acetivibrio straminisolvens JCM 21531 TaxID=1294263 RepID=W4V6H3_9FIRM|nr:DUF6382 domain-containing protein [Acetivibrio straminisolvens]GAE88791.1 membrane protein [Acetivibrio straminisolvens JCM 21531]